MYSEESRVYQKFIQSLTFEGCVPMLGVWMAGPEAVGLGIREDDSLITKNNSRFIPHVWE
ncbi:putative glutathionylspermidine synthase preATP-grasp [Aeromonas phage LAh_8]|nr:glutathionylspermidine synthase [Aeromonas phage LAh_8]QDH46842.1 putative glutathionylspermidine synthase preATP-grasp [Aeromonas phage LAh_8]